MENNNIVNKDNKGNEDKHHDIDTIRHLYATLKQLHIRANNENERLNDVNENFKSEIVDLKGKITQLVNASALSQKMIADAYTKINSDKEDYINVIQSLEADIRRLKEEE